MDILDQLARERSRRSATASTDEDVPEALQRAMERLYAGITRLADGLTKLNPDVYPEYAIESVGRFTDLRQGDYSVETEDPVLPRFVFSFTCEGLKSLGHVVSTVAQKDQMRELLSGHGLSFNIDDMSTWRYVFSVKPLVTVRLSFEPVVERGAVQMSARNLERLGIELFSIYPDQISNELFNELGKMVLRRENRFAELTGNRVDNVTRRELQEKVESRQRDREQEARDLTAQETTKNSSLKGLLRRRKVAAPQVTRTTVAPAVPDESPDDGFIDWDSGAPPGAAREAQGGRSGSGSTVDDDLGLPAPLPEIEGLEPTTAPTYAWLITEDNLADNTAASVGRRGPAGVGRAFTTSQILNGGAKFRLVNREGTARFSGMIAGHYQGIEPLVDFGMDHDCYVIEYLRDGSWVRVRPTD